MAKEIKKAKPKERPSTYDEKLKVNGSFLDIMKAAAKNANNNAAIKKP